MRITGGRACRIRLLVPKHADVRPSMDTSRERVFNRIGSDLPGTIVFDCFAGNGAYGLEALSRGASLCYFFEKSYKLIECLQKNCLSVCKSMRSDPSTCTKIIRTDLFATDFATFLPPNFIFFDPPYRFWDENNHALHRVLTALATLFPIAVLVLEFPSQSAWTTQSPWQPIRPLETSPKINEARTELFRVVDR